MRYAKVLSARLAAIAMCAMGALACHSRTQEIGFGHCEIFPPDTVPLPPISVRDSANAPGVVVVTVFAGRSIIPALVHLDSANVSSRAVARFAGIIPGPHQLRVLVVGFRGRRATINMPQGSGLVVDVPVSRGGMNYCEDGEYLRTIPWWKFWDR